MPLTAFQHEVFSTLRRGRSPNSFIFGATVLNASAQTPRYSKDIDICHDLETAVAESAAADEAALVAAGYTVSWQLRQPLFQRATVTRHDGSVKLEWVYDSAFRFYPVEPDDELGWRLHFADAATNKLLALSGRAEPRDFVDAIHLHENYLSLGTLAWAAAGKDEGLNPRLILDLADRFARYRQADIDSLHLAAQFRLEDLKARWSMAIEEGRQLVEKLPPSEIGCLYLDPQTSRPVSPIPGSLYLDQLVRHYGSIGGSWPRMAKQ
ncbi:nucleotidyl transferase AbiEii/AbiGii toxin family protein [Prosthecobacter sp.]|uniref:nucleotidyl transferase AbiEii/AbiGii toxin family protein n=1 Tax=Prosthecobacter sp. TaxID=1965333 RepID=UPI003784DEB2